jgi:hypothetical protein
MEYTFVIEDVLVVMQFGISPGTGEGITESLISEESGKKSESGVTTDLKYCD